MGPHFLFGAENAVTVAVQQMNDGVVSGLAVAVLKDLNVSILGGVFADPLREFDGAVMRVGVANESANEANEDVGSGLRRPAADSTIGGERKRNGGPD